MLRGKCLCFDFKLASNLFILRDLTDDVSLGVVKMSVLCLFNRFLIYCTTLCGNFSSISQDFQGYSSQKKTTRDK